MKKIFTTAVLFLSLCGCFMAPTLMAQEAEEESNVSLDVNADLVSRYLWRGLLLSPAANVQPYATLNIGNFSVGAWGSYSLNDFYAEADIFAAYSVGNVTLTVTDYFTNQDTAANYGYFDWKKGSTLHTLEGMVNWTVSENFPLSLTAGTMFYGYDTDDAGKQLYSTYLEAAYPVTIGENSLDIFAGFTPAAGYYAGKANLMNIGVKAAREIKVTDTFSMPLSITFAVNPEVKRAFLVAALTF